MLFAPSLPSISTLHRAATFGAVMSLKVGHILQATADSGCKNREERDGPRFYSE